MKAKAMIWKIVLSIPIFVSLSGCSESFEPIFGGATNLEEGTYDEYIKIRLYDTIDPISATNIYYRCLITRDSYEEWWRFKISKANYDLLLEKAKSSRVGDVTVFESKGSTEFPDDWDFDEQIWPSWWKIHPAPDTYETSIWKTPIRKGSRQTLGWFFTYDSKTGIAWVGFWNHQYD